MAVISVTAEMDSRKSMEMMGSQSRSQQVVALVSRDKAGMITILVKRDQKLECIYADDL